MSEKYILRSKAIAARTLGDETIIMSAVDSTLFNLSEVGTVIWQAADGRTPLSEIVNGKICEEFDVTSEAAYADALAFVEGLSRHGILRVLDHPITETSQRGAEPS
jgi:Coenzyme PQQ synthesis protein D (PqqD)